LWKKRRERPLCITHSDPLTGTEFVVGSPVEVEGSLYVVTGWRELPPVRLARGGSAREWEILGRPLKGSEVSEALARELEDILHHPAQLDSSAAPETPAPEAGRETGVPHDGRSQGADQGDSHDRGRHLSQDQGEQGSQAG
jgi:hypothetical protein